MFVHCLSFVNPVYYKAAPGKEQVCNARESGQKLWYEMRIPHFKIKMNYLPDKETTFEKKVQTAKENLFKKMIANEEHVLCQFLPPKKEDKYSLRSQSSPLPAPC